MVYTPKLLRRLRWNFLQAGLTLPTMRVMRCWLLTKIRAAAHFSPPPFPSSVLGSFCSSLFLPRGAVSPLWRATKGMASFNVFSRRTEDPTQPPGPRPIGEIHPHSEASFFPRDSPSGHYQFYQGQLIRGARSIVRHAFIQSSALHCLLCRRGSPFERSSRGLIATL